MIGEFHHKWRNNLFIIYNLEKFLSLCASDIIASRDLSLPKIAEFY